MEHPINPYMEPAVAKVMTKPIANPHIDPAAEPVAKIVTKHTISISAKGSAVKRMMHIRRC